MKSESHQKLIEYALRISSKKRYTLHELEMKLTRFAHKHEKCEEEDIEPVIARLIELKYIDDYEYCLDYISGRIKLRPRGKFLISRELKFKGIPVETIAKAFEEKVIDEDAVALNALESKMNKWRALDIAKQKMKAFQFLYSRGFARDAIYSAVERCYSIPAS